MATDSHTTFSEQLYQSVNDSKQLPVPDAYSTEHSLKLIETIRNEIGDGAISFQRFMDLTLYSPGLGYYNAGSTKLGKDGDFITAPEISSLFSQTLANAILPIVNKDNIILEVGAGSGTMAADILLYLNKKNNLPKEYWILELSADLRERQKQTIKKTIPELLDRVKWLDVLPEKFSGIVLANELLDAMPVQLFQKTESGINEVNVTWDKDKFAYQFEAAPSNKNNRLLERVKNIESETGSNFPQGYISEVNFLAEDWIKSIAESLTEGVMILIDYGFPRHEYYHAQRNQGTLMCHYRHRTHADPFVYPGLQDITAHVDFTAMADAALVSGLKIIGYTNQANFLIGAGLMELVKKTEEKKLVDQLEITSQIKKLTMPHEMGELFKVIGFSKNCDVSLPAFEFRDLREYL